jgi:hypothetical protein
MLRLELCIKLSSGTFDKMLKKLIDYSANRNTFNPCVIPQKTWTRKPGLENLDTHCLMYQWVIT